MFLWEHSVMCAWERCRSYYAAASDLSWEAIGHAHWRFVVWQGEQVTLHVLCSEPRLWGNHVIPHKCAPPESPRVHYRCHYELVLVIVYLETFLSPHQVHFHVGFSHSPWFTRPGFLLLWKPRCQQYAIANLNPHLIWTFTQVPFLSQDCTLHIVVGSS